MARLRIGYGYGYKRLKAVAAATLSDTEVLSIWLAGVWRGLVTR